MFPLMVTVIGMIIGGTIIPVKDCLFKGGNIPTCDHEFFLQLNHSQAGFNSHHSTKLLFA